MRSLNHVTIAMNVSRIRHQDANLARMVQLRGDVSSRFPRFTTPAKARSRACHYGRPTCLASERCTSRRLPSRTPERSPTTWHRLSRQDATITRVLGLS